MHPSVRTRARRSSSAARGNGRKVGINENLAREILELHTLGVDGGYTQADVTHVRAGHLRLVDRRAGQNGRRLARFGVDNGTPGEFLFREVFHEPGAKHLLGKTLRRRRRRSRARRILRDLAHAARRPRATSAPSSRGISSRTIRRAPRWSA